VTAIPWRPAALALLALALASMLGCSSSHELSRKERADRSFARRDWAAAIQDYQVYLEESGLGAEAMLAHFMLGRAYLENGDYPTAAVEFEVFQRDYPRSDSLAAAAFYEALCWVKQSPAYDRDATPTLKAIQVLDDFLLDFPGSPQVPWAQKAHAEMQGKLAEKSLSIARLYRRMERPLAAVLYYEKLLREQPESAQAETGLLELIALQLGEGNRAEAERLAARATALRPDSELARRAQALLAN
jgi:outer membrane protein assembly factor BamD